MFERDYPHYMLMGMSYDEYWYGDPWLIKFYLEKDRLEQDRENTKCWLQGLYVWEAVSSAISAAFAKNSNEVVKYPDQPHSLRGEEEKQVSEDQEALIAEIYMRQMEEAGKHWKTA